MSSETTYSVGDTDAACIVGISDLENYRKPGSGMDDLEIVIESAWRAIDDAGLAPSDIDGIVAPYINATAEDLILNLGAKRTRFTCEVNMGGASAVASLQVAALAVSAGQAEFVVIPFAWNGFSGVRARASATTDGATAFRRTVRDFYLEHGTTAPPQVYALMANRHIHEFDTPAEATGAIAVACRNHAQLNSKAYMNGRRISMDEYLVSRWIVEPFRLLDCCLETDSGAAVVVTSVERARRMGVDKPVRISAVAAARPNPPTDICNRPDILSIGLTHAAPLAYEQAGIGPWDADFAQIYDCFTFVMLQQIEEAGFANRGDGADLVCSGAIELGGRMPMNTHGGLLSNGHSLGMGHVTEAVRQLRGQAGPAQVDNARVGIVTGWGDLGDGSIAVLRT